MGPPAAGVPEQCLQGGVCGNCGTKWNANTALCHTNVGLCFLADGAGQIALDAAIGSSSGGASDGALGGIAGMSSTLPPAWVDFSEEASADIAAIKDKLRELSSAHAKALLPTFDDVGGAVEGNRP